VIIMLWFRRGLMAMLLAVLCLLLFSGCQAVAGYLLYDLITGGPIFGDDGGDGNGNGNGDANHDPVIVTAFAVPNTITVGGTVTLTVTATDEDGDVLTYLWTATRGEFSDETAAATLWTAPSGNTGIFQIMITVSDGMGGVDYAVVEVEVTI
jgi:hypothetical protein